MRLFRQYSSLKNYLHRYTIIHIGRLHIRLHRIKSDDATNLLHSHPFNYITVILKGGYDDVQEHKISKLTTGSIAFRSSETFHRIINVKPNTLTLFITWIRKDNHWEVKPLTDNQEYEPGVYLRRIKDKFIYSKYDQYWFKSSYCPEKAKLETKPSIDQTTNPTTENPLCYL